jgi:hypothetical protein
MLSSLSVGGVFLNYLEALSGQQKFRVSMIKELEQMNRKEETFWLGISSDLLH